MDDAAASSAAPPAAPAAAAAPPNNNNTTNNTNNNNDNVYNNCCAVAPLAGAHVPTQWSTKDKYRDVEIPDGFANLRASYAGAGKTDQDAAAVRSNYSIPSSSGIFYFEITIVNKGKDGFIGIGLSIAGVNTNRLPGWERGSYGYHGDDGNCFRGSGGGLAYGPKFTTGDVIGCCVNYVNNTIFYTKNGTNIGIAFTDVAQKDLFPIVGLRTKGEIVHANFGQDKFVFDFNGYVGEQKKKAVADIITSASLKMNAAEEQTVITKIIHSYLVQRGLANTATQFAKDIAVEMGEKEMNEMKIRQNIRSLVLNGEIDKAIAMTNEFNPQVFTSSRVLFFLHCQQFVELVKSAPITETMAYGKKNLSKYAKDSNFDQSLLTNTFSLLAYPNPAASPIAYLLDERRREPLADLLNSALTMRGASCTGLELLLKQTQVVLEELKTSINPGPAALISLNQFLS